MPRAGSQLSDELSGLPLAILGIGIGIGAVLAGRLSASKIEIGLIPPGCLCLAGALPGTGPDSAQPDRHA